MNIIFVGLSGVAYSQRAIDVRLNSFINIFVSLGHNVKILNRYSSLKSIRPCFLNSNAQVDIIEIINRRSSSILDVLFYFFSLLIEPIKLIGLHKENKINIIHITSGHFIDIVIYSVIAKFLQAKIVYHYCEFRLAFPNQSIYHKINGKLLDKYAPKFWDGAICISQFLVNKTLEVNYNVRTIKVPPICNFQTFDKINSINVNPPYLLFCGSTDYFEVIKLIIDSYLNSKIKQSVKLKMVINGSRIKINEIQQLCPELEILQKLEYTELIQYYKNAIGLLIPLRNTTQDIARFPNKICEYTASYGLIITTKNGEIPNYFQDKVNALIADDFSVPEIVKKLDWLYDNSDILGPIKKQSYLLGKKYFESSLYLEATKIFISQLFE